MSGLVFAATMDSDNKAFIPHKRLSLHWNPKALLQNFPDFPVEASIGDAKVSG